MENENIQEITDNYYILNDDNSKSAAYTLNELAILKINEMITSNTLIIRNGEDPKPAGTFLDSYNPNILNILETEDSEMLPEELNTFNLGAYILAPFWGYSHFPKYKAYWGGLIILLCLSFLTLMYIPKHTLMQLFAYSFVVFLILSMTLSPMGIIFLIKGNNLAWKNRKFESIDQFKNIQKKWFIWGCIIYLLLSVILFSAPDTKFSKIIIKASLYYYYIKYNCKEYNYDPFQYDYNPFLDDYNPYLNNYNPKGTNGKIIPPNPPDISGIPAAPNMQKTY